MTAKNIKFDYQKKGAVAVSDKGEADIKLVLGAQAILQRSTTSALAHYDSSSLRVENCDVSFHGTGKDSVYDLVWPLIRKSIVKKIEQKGQAWLESQLSYWLPAKPSLPPPLSKSRRSSRYEPVSAGVTTSWMDTHADARDRFRHELRRHPGLRSDVLDKLESPFSNPPSAPPSEAGDDGTGRFPSPKFVRRKSMAEYLTDVSSKDATLETNITSPPVASAGALPSGFHEDENVDYEYMAASLSNTSRRDTTTPDAAANPPIDPTGEMMSAFAHHDRAPRYAGEMSFEEYEHVTADRDQPTMARSLSEVASRDATTIDAIREPPSAVGPSSFEASQDRFTQPPMNKVTRDLSGLPDDSNAAIGAPKLGSRSMSSPAPVAGPGLRSLSRMSDVLNEATTQDYTSPEAQVSMHRTGSRGAETTSDTGLTQHELKERRKSFALSEDAMRDATLPENIASPTSTMRRTFSSSSSSRVASPSTYTGLKNVLPMGATLDGALEEDLTLPERQADYHRLQRTASRESGESFTGIDPESLKKRRMSSYLSDSAKQDATLYDNVAAVRL
jgi:hypothetical protein